MSSRALRSWRSSCTPRWSCGRSDRGSSLNAAFAAGIAGLIIFIEDRLRQTPLPQCRRGTHQRHRRSPARAVDWRRALLGERQQHRRHLPAHTHPSRAALYRARARREIRRVARARAIAGLFRPQTQQRRYRILDTSVIIDGRIADICETGFVDGTLVVPQFVLKELQPVADSSDSMKRNRGRRGLDILQRIQKMAGLDVMISDADFPDVKEVDLKLIELARSLQGKIVTNDFNLNKVAQLRGVAPPVAATIAFVFLLNPGTGPVNDILGKLGAAAPGLVQRPDVVQARADPAGPVGHRRPHGHLHGGAAGRAQAAVRGRRPRRRRRLAAVPLRHPADHLADRDVRRGHRRHPDHAVLHPGAGRRKGRAAASSAHRASSSSPATPTSRR